MFNHSDFDGILGGGLDDGIGSLVALVTLLVAYVDALENHDT